MKYLKRITYFFSLAGILSLAQNAYAQIASCPTGFTISGDTCVPANAGGFFTGVDSISQLIIKSLDIALLLAGLVAVIFLVIGGYRYIFAGGSDDAGTAKNTIKNALIGLVIVLLAFAIVRIVANAVYGTI